MQMQKEIQFADNVILLDVGFLNGIANGLKNALENLEKIEKIEDSMDINKPKAKKKRPLLRSFS